MIKKIFSIFRRQAVAEPPPPATPEEKPKKISQAAVARFKTKPSAIMGDAVSFPMPLAGDAWKIPPPPPGVGGKDCHLAMDEAFGDTYAQYAMQSLYNEGLCFLGYPYLAQLSQRPEYRRAATVLAEEMTRKWIKFNCTGAKEEKAEKIEIIKTEFTRLKVQERCRQALEHDSIFGKGQIFIDFGSSANSGELGKELVPTKIKVIRPIKELTIVEPMWTYPATYNANDPLRPDFYKPSSWYVMSQDVHASRLLTFIANPLPDILKPAYLFGGLSLLQMLKPYVDNWLETRQNVNQIVKSFITYVLKTNMSGILGGDSGESLASRLDIWNSNKTNQDVLALDKDTEDFISTATPLSGLSELQAQSQEHIVSACGLPLVLYTGISPSGLNSSADAELRVWGDHVAASQEKDLRTNIDFIFKLVQIGSFGEIDPELTFDFIPLMEMTEKEQVDMEKARGENDCNMVNAGILMPETVLQRLSDDETSPYYGIDVVAPDPPMEEEPTNEPADGTKAQDSAVSILDQVKKGIDEESDHLDVVDGDEVKILQIVTEHLVEDPNYYSKLSKVFDKEFTEHLVEDPNYYSKLSKAFDKEFIESEHPRENDGKFGSGGGGGTALDPKVEKKAKSSAPPDSVAGFVKKSKSKVSSTNPPPGFMMDIPPGVKESVYESISVDDLKSDNPNQQKNINYIRRSIEIGAEDKKYNVSVQLNEKGDIIGACSMHSLPDSIRIETLGGLGGGAGKSLLLAAIKKSEKAGKKGAITLTPVAEAVTWYVKQGFVDKPNSRYNEFWLSPEAAQKLLKG